MAKIGEPLPTPEAGWKRYDDRDDNIQFSQNVNRLSSSAWYNSTITSKGYENVWCKFNFIGTGIRLISQVADKHFSDSVKIIIDQKAYKFSQFNALVINQVVCFERLGLRNKEHSVKIYTDDDMGFNLDAIDILKEGELLPYDESVAVLKVSLIKSSNKIQSLSENNEWVDMGLTEPLTQVDFEQHGIDDLSVVPKEKWQELDDSFEVITWTDEEPVEFEGKVSGNELEWIEEGKLFEMVMDDERDVLKLNNVEVR